MGGLGSSSSCVREAPHAPPLAEPWCPERCGGACLPQLEPLVARKKSLTVLTGPHSVPLTSAQFHPPPGSRQGLYQGSWKEPVAQHCPCPGPTWGAQTPPRAARLPHAVCPCLLSATLALGLHHAASGTPPTSPLPGNMPILLLHLALAVAHCDGGVQAGEAEGLRTPLSASVLVSEPLATSVPAHVASDAPSPPSSPQPPLTGGFGGGFCLFLCRRKKKAFSFVKGWLCFGGLLFSWFCLVFISPGISSLYLVTSPFFSPALSSSTDATRWQF